LTASFAVSGEAVALSLMKSLTFSFERDLWSERKTSSLCHSLRAAVNVAVEVFSATMVAMASSHASPFKAEDSSAILHSLEIGEVGSWIANVTRRDLAIRVAFPIGCHSSNSGWSCEMWPSSTRSR